MLSHAVLFDAIDRHLQALRDGGEVGRVMGLLVLRVQRLRELNIRLGYDSVRELLEAARSRIVATLRPQDEVGEFAPGEFVVVLPTVMSANHALLGAHRLAQAFQQPLRANGHEVVVNVVIGVSAANGGEATSEQLLRQADMAYGHALKEPDRVALHEHDDGQVVPPYEFLRDAIASNRLVMYLQPIYDLRDGRLVGAEALARWPDSPLGPVPPDVFIPLAEETGQIAELTRWGLNTTLRLAAEGRFAERGLYVSFNLSPRVFLEPGLGDQIGDALRLWSMPPAALMLEVTENALMENPAAAARVLDELAGAGMGVAIDDFGSGYSSFAYLKAFPVSKLKIDRMFVMDMASEQRSAQLARSMIDLGHNLGVEVVAEGVEDAGTLELLRGMGCDYAQGYHLGRPAPAAAFPSGD